MAKVEGEKYKYKASKVSIKLNKDQREAFRKMQIASRFIFNSMLAYQQYRYLSSKDYSELYIKDQQFVDKYLLNTHNKDLTELADAKFKTDKIHLSNFDMGSLISKYKKTFEKNQWPFLNDKAVSSVILATSVANLSTAYDNFWLGLKQGRRIGAPKFKRSDIYGSIGLNDIRGIKATQNEYTSVPKLKTIAYRSGRKRAKGDMISTTITYNPTDKYTMSTVMRTPDHTPTLKHIRKAVGIDMNVNDTLVLSTGEAFALPKETLLKEEAKYKMWSSKMQQRLDRYEKELAIENARRKQEGLAELRFNKYDCKGYMKARKARAKAFARATQTKDYFIDLVTTEILRNNNLVVIEDLKVSNMMKMHSLAGSLARNSFYKVRTALEQKAKRYGCVVITVDPKYTSQTCSHCGVRNTEDFAVDKGLSRLGVRRFVCTSCPYTESRDVNAACNILTKGLKAFKEQQKEAQAKYLKDPEKQVDLYDIQFNDLDVFNQQQYNMNKYTEYAQEFLQDLRYKDESKLVYTLD